MEKSLHWKRPPGPVNVWRVKESTKVFKNGKPMKFVIQEIPEDRIEEAVSHMCKDYLADEPLAASMNMRNDPEAIKDMSKIWRMILKQGCGTGAFVEEPGNKKPVLAAMNVTHVVSEEDSKTIKQIVSTMKSESTKKYILTAMNVMKGCDMKKLYGIDKYLSAFGLSVAPEFRGEKLGLEILLARNDIGKKYSIIGTSTFFSAVASQKLATIAGFELAFEKLYDDVYDEKGNVAFPGLKGKTLKMMHKRIS